MTRREGVPPPLFETVHGRHSSMRRAPSGVPVSRLLKSRPAGVIDRQRVDRALRARWQTSRRRRTNRQARRCPRESCRSARGRTPSPKAFGADPPSVCGTLPHHLAHPASDFSPVSYVASSVPGSWPARPGRFERSRNCKKRTRWHQRCSKGACPRWISRIAVKQTTNKRKQTAC